MKREKCMLFVRLVERKDYVQKYTKGIVKPLTNTRIECDENNKD